MKLYTVQWRATHNHDWRIDYSDGPGCLLVFDNQGDAESAADKKRRTMPEFHFRVTAHHLLPGTPA